LINLVAAVLLSVAALPAAAQSPDPTRGSWMAASSTEPSLDGRSWGRMTMSDGVLEFQSSNYEWRLSLAEIKRIAVSKQVARGLEIESAEGQVYFVGILNGQLTATSPGKTVQAIQRAVRALPARAPVRSTLLASGGGSSQ